MGTNYYVTTNVCPTCGRGDERIHVGKSSMGWSFSFAWNDGEYYKSLAEFKKWLKGKKILDEYDKPISQKEFWEMVEAKKDGLTLETYYEKYPDHRNGISAHEHEIEVDGIRFVRGEFS